MKRLGSRGRPHCSLFAAAGVSALVVAVICAGPARADSVPPPSVQDIYVNTNFDRLVPSQVIGPADVSSLARPVVTPLSQLTLNAGQAAVVSGEVGGTAAVDATTGAGLLTGALDASPMLALDPPALAIAGATVLAGVAAYSGIKFAVGLFASNGSTGAAYVCTTCKSYAAGFSLKSDWNYRGYGYWEADMAPQLPTSEYQLDCSVMYTTPSGVYYNGSCSNEDDDYQGCNYNCINARYSSQTGTAFIRVFGYGGVHPSSMCVSVRSSADNAYHPALSYGSEIGNCVNAGGGGSNSNGGTGTGVRVVQTCEGSGGATSTVESWATAQAQTNGVGLATVPSPVCPSGTQAIGASVDTFPEGPNGVKPDDSSANFNHVGTYALPEPLRVTHGKPDPYADCVDAIAKFGPCVAVATLVTATGVHPCTDDGIDCGSFTQPDTGTRTTRQNAPDGKEYGCNYGPYVNVPMGLCHGYAPSTTPTTTPGTGTDPSAAPTPGPEQASPAPGVGPGTDTQTQDPDPKRRKGTEGSNCFPSGWGLLNPITWVEKPVKCALVWAFAPDTDVLTSEVNDLQDSFSDSFLGQGAGLAAHFAGVFTAGPGGGCQQGPAFDFGAIDPTLFSHDPLVIHPLDACSGFGQTVAAYLRPIGVTFLYLTTAAIAYNMLGRTVGITQ